MRIAVPLYSIVHRAIGGTESAIYNFVSGLHAIGAEVEVYLSDENKLAPKFVSWMRESGVPMHKTKGGAAARNKNVRFLEEAKFALLNCDADWIVYPNYFIPPIPFLKGKVAVILHDIQYKTLPNLHSWRRRVWLDFYLPIMFLMADVVLLISESERELVRRFFGSAAADKCRVIYNAIDWQRYNDIGSRAEVDAPPYMLSVFHPFPHKNVQNLVLAFNEVINRGVDIDLYMVGVRSEFSDNIIRSLASEAALKRIKFLGFVSDEELGRLYRGAELFALPSLYEGFGMPAVEAMGLGTSAILSDIPALREVTLGEAIYVDPTDVVGWADAICRELQSPRDLSDVSSRLRRKFAPDNVARNTVKVLHEFSPPSHR